MPCIAAHDRESRVRSEQWPTSCIQDLAACTLVPDTLNERQLCTALKSGLTESCAESAVTGKLGGGRFQTSSV
jgi:hypothetical protein